MRPLETLLSLANLLTFLILAIPSLRHVRWMRQWMRHSALVALPILGAQALTEGPRWQMVPAYALGGVFFLTWLLRGRKSVNEIRNRSLTYRLAALLGIGSGGLILAGSIVMPILFPVFRFPRPSGSYGIGTLTYYWVDTNRPEAFLADPSVRRRLMVQIWYPAKDDPSLPRAPYVPDPGVLAPLARLLRLPGFIFGHFKYVTTNAAASAPVAGDESRFPVLICSHGRGGYRQENTWLTEELVSHGYIVACIDHPYAASGVLFPDGSQVAFDSHMLDRAFVEGKIAYLAQDARFTLDQLDVLNRSDPNGILTGRLDLQHVGIFGLSLGGEISAEACRQDPRFGACLVMDVWMPADVLQAGLRQPTMFLTRDAKTMRLEGWSEADTNETLSTMQSVYARLPGVGYFVQVPGMFHQDFSDAPLFSSLTRTLGVTGPIDGQRAHNISSAYALAFFDKVLKGQSPTLFVGAAEQYPEVLFETRQPG